MSDIACEGCAKELHEGDMAHHCADGVDLCEACAPTFQDLLDETGEREAGEDDDPELTAEVRGWIDRHLAAGGALSDKAVQPIPIVTEADLARVRAAMEDAEDAPPATETHH